MINGQDMRRSIGEKTPAANVAIRPRAGTAQLCRAAVELEHQTQSGGAEGTLIGIPPASPRSLFLPSGQHPVAQWCYIPGLSVLSADNKQPNTRARATEVCWIRAWLPRSLRLLQTLGETAALCSLSPGFKALCSVRRSACMRWELGGFFSGISSRPELI